mgnify:FL=1|jgi:hypothetical protein
MFDLRSKSADFSYFMKINNVCKIQMIAEGRKI